MDIETKDKMGNCCGMIIIIIAMQQYTQSQSQRTLNNFFIR